MEHRSKHVAFVAPLPPPVHGFSWISARILEKASIDSTVEVFDVRPAGGRVLITFLRFARSLLAGRLRTLYVALSGGSRQWIDLAFLVLGRFFGLRVFVHHHSCSYLNDSFLPTRLVCSLGAVTHVVLCGHMGKLLCDRYQVPKSHLHFLSNAAFVEQLPDAESLAGHMSPGQVTLGFLSNITFEKGIFDFFDLLDRCAQSGVRVKAVIAGPVDAGIEAEFRARLSSVADCIHLGPVYGEAKSDFFAGIDVLVFPSRYRNEAEPVTILEALAFGKPVIATALGCVPGMLSGSCGGTFDADAFQAGAVAAIRELLDPKVLRLKSMEARKAYLQRKSDANTAVDALLDSF